MKRNYLFTFLLSVFIFSNSAFANQNDSLLNVIKTSKNTEERIDAYLSLSKLMLRKNLDSADKMIDSLLRWSIRENIENKIARSYNMRGVYFWYKGNYDSAIYFFHKTREYSILNEIIQDQTRASSNLGAIYNMFGETDSAKKYLIESIALARQVNDLKSVAKISYDLGNLFGNLGNYEKALEYFIESQKLLEDFNDSVKLIHLYNSFGSTYQEIGNFEKSLEFYMIAMELDLIVDDVNILHDILNNLGVLYWQLAREFDSARHYILSSLEMQPDKINPINKQTTFINLGGIELDDEKYNKALEYFRKAQSEEISYPSLYIQSALFINMGIAFKGLGQYDSARYYTFKGLKIARETNTKMWIKYAYNNLFLIDSIENRLDSAMYYLSKYHAIKDSLSNDEIDGKIAELEIRYETEKKEIENQELKNQNDLNEQLIKNQNIAIIIGVFAFILFILYFITVLRSRKAQKQKNIELARFNKKILSQQQQLERANFKLENQKKQLSELNITKDKFFSIIAHDLKSPFNVLLGFLELLEHEFDDLSNKEKLEIIKTLQKSSQNTYNLLLNLLDWSKSQRGVIKNNPKMIDLSVNVANVISMLKETSRKKEQSIHNNIPINTSVLADPELIQSIFINLISNSIKFTPKKGDIYISVKDKGELMEICIKDTGIGIQEEIIPKLFNIDCDYNQLGTDNEPGTGLGLTIVREFIELLGSSIHVESELGKGSRFYFTLPKA
jgi:signal transduction histidine kinase